MDSSWAGSKAFLYGIAGAASGLLYATSALLVNNWFGSWHEYLHLLIAPLLLGAAAVLIGREEDQVRRQASLLDEARKRFTSLTHSAVAERDWEVSFHDPGIPTCWEEKSCEAEECPCYGKRHVRCWLVAGTYCRGEVQGHFAQKLGDCSRCGVYQQAVENDPINEIGENFNSLMWALREKEEMLELANTDLQEQFRELEELQRRTRALADTDMLTGLYNHGHFQEYLKGQVLRCRRGENPLTVMMFDLDRFKSVNDNFGHQKGDMVLKGIGQLVSAELAGEDEFYAARYGGEEFVLVMPGVGPQDAVKAAERLRGKLRRVAEDTGLPARYVTASFGVADMPDCGSDASSLISAADAALLFAKRRGRDRVAHFLDLSRTELREGDLDRLNSRLAGASLETIRALAEAVNDSDSYSPIQGSTMASVAEGMALRLGMKQEQADALALATRLHDIGKIGVPGSVLRKTGKLSEEERDLVQQHPEMGQRILEEGKQIKDLVSAILYHHERWDGKGYPEQLKGEQIPLMARVIGIIDAYRAMLCDRPYRKALTINEAIDELRKGAGTQFDPKLVDLFVDMIVEGEASTGLREVG